MMIYHTAPDVNSILTPVALTVWLSGEAAGWRDACASRLAGGVTLGGVRLSHLLDGHSPLVGDYSTYGISAMYFQEICPPGSTW